MKVEIGTEAAQFPEKEYINGIAVLDTNVNKSCRLLLFLTPFTGFPGGRGGGGVNPLSTSVPYKICAFNKIFKGDSKDFIASWFLSFFFIL